MSQTIATLINTKSVYEALIDTTKITIPQALTDTVETELDDFIPDTINFPAKISDELREKYPEEQRKVLYVSVIMKCTLNVSRNFRSYVPKLEVEAFFEHDPAKKIVKTIEGRKREFRIKELASELRKLYRGQVKQ